MPQQVHKVPYWRRPLAQTCMKLCVGGLLAAPVLVSAAFFLFFIVLARKLVALWNSLHSFGRSRLFGARTSQDSEEEYPDDAHENEAAR